ncbi:hypothetical protein BaRGS_00025225 [Batillaria attramentaria]|uniref:Sulfatase N-terminal domain-containing protein n=1 Tax=Batillaria attramentaria TaxID=370345 RepID=A0ABD0K8W6_9CAEN|nr:hypothetical protein BaRGS_008431 [Batillaria attramentaria]
MKISRVLVLVVLTYVAASTVLATKPNIVVILADDLGFSDVGWRNPALHSPTLDRLAREGVVLNQAYVQPSCSPSRAALMSGRYPYHLGLQHSGLSAGHVGYLPDDQPILPETLKSLGYATHAVGKWHLGFCNWRYTPTYRGFDSFYGFYNAEEDYYNHTGHRDAYDFRDDDQVDVTAKGHYSTHLFTDRAIRIIRRHNSSQPLFLYLSFQAVHTPLEVPEYYMHRFCSHINDTDRQIKCGMIAAMDEAVANVTHVLEQQGLADNTFLLFSSDNGGPVKTGGSNWPLRGSKTTIWEGGTRAVAFMHAPNLLQKSGYTYNELIHVVDWYPTFVEAGGGSNLSNIDGVSQWQNLLAGTPGPRFEFIYNIDDVFNNAAIRQGRYKLTQGHMNGPNGWFAPPEMTNETTVEVHVNRHNEPAYQLFDLEADPEEKHSILDTHQHVFQRLKFRLDEYRPSIVPTDPSGDVFVHEANPKYFNDVWSPGWC